MKTKVTFYLKDPSAKRDTLIYAFFHFDGTRIKLSTGQKIHPKLWSPSKQRVKSGAMLETPINSRLDAIASVKQTD